MQSGTVALTNNPTLLTGAMDSPVRRVTHAVHFNPPFAEPPLFVAFLCGYAMVSTRDQRISVAGSDATASGANVSVSTWRGECGWCVFAHLPQLRRLVGQLRLGGVARSGQRAGSTARRTHSRRHAVPRPQDAG